MKRSVDRLRTTHVGSLPRPNSVIELLIKKERAEPYDPAQFDALIGAAVADAVAMQVRLGIDAVSDGEIGKIGYATYIQERLSGFGGHTDRKSALDLAEYPELRKKLAAIMGSQSFNRASCIGPVALTNRAPLDQDLRRMRAAVQQAGADEAFMTAASPGVVTAFQPNAFYPTHELYAEAVGAAMRQEYEAIVAAGFVLQLDCPDLAMARHTGFQDLSEAEFLHRAAHHVEVLNAAVAGIPADKMRLHVCWGNYEGPHDFDIEARKILPIVFKAKPAAISFEAANPRHEHEWVDWKAAHVPQDKLLIPGVLDTRTNYVEHPELVAQRLCTFADIVGRERVIAGTDCGFGTFAGYGKVDPGVALKKLRAMVEGARIASHRLWS